MARLQHLLRIAGCLVAAMPFAAAAQVATPAGPTAAAPAAPFASASALTDDGLGAVAGREDIHQASLADQQATVTRNSVGDNVHTGDATIADNAFQNMSGLSILNVNTGNNVAFNAAMNVTIAIQPGQ